MSVRRDGTLGKLPLGRVIGLGALVALAGVGASGQSTAAPAAAASRASSLAASQNDALLAKANALYDSTAKSGLLGFDCQVHPDWKQIISSARHGAAVADDDPRLALVSRVKITLHARLADGASLDWLEPAQTGKTADKPSAALLDRAHHGIENTLLGVLKLWSPLVDGSIAESLGEEDAAITATGAGYTLQSRDRSQLGRSLTEEFDRSLVLTHYVTTDGGAAEDLAPSYQAGPHGLLLSGFLARIAPVAATGVAATGAAATGAAATGAGATMSGAAGSQQMQVGVAYQTVSGVEIPAALNIDVTGVVTMNFKLDGCAVRLR